MFLYTFKGTNTHNDTWTVSANFPTMNGPLTPHTMTVIHPTIKLTQHTALTHFSSNIPPHKHTQAKCTLCKLTQLFVRNFSEELYSAAGDSIQTPAGGLFGKDKMSDWRGWTTDSKSSWYQRFFLAGLYRCFLYKRDIESLHQSSSSWKGLHIAHSWSFDGFKLHCCAFTALREKTDSSYFNGRMLFLCRMEDLFYSTF